MRYETRSLTEKRAETEVDHLPGSIIVSSLLMWKTGAHNKKMDAMCLREGIDSNMEDKYSELGDNSPLYR
jgi:hypothetical protein